MKMFEKYRSCVLAFGELFYPKIRIEGKDVVYAGLDEAMSNLSMKCLRETENEDIAKEFAMMSALREVTMIQFHYGTGLHSPSFSAAILFVCKHLNQLKHFSVSAHVFENLDCVLEITKLLHHRCIETLEFITCRTSPVQVS